MQGSELLDHFKSFLFVVIQTLVVIGDLDLFRSFLSPNEAHPELIVDPDRVLPGPILGQSLKPVSRRRAQVVQIYCSIEIPKLSAGHLHEVGWKPFRALALIDGFRRPAFEVSDQVTNVSDNDTKTSRLCRKLMHTESLRCPPPGVMRIALPPSPRRRHLYLYHLRRRLHPRLDAGARGAAARHHPGVPHLV